ncbi:GPP34 family phosphoprotein [Streptomyces sp. NPDC048825]|uniref:GPP34 family phosphoprotein n=1 Tax=Streptomyces sp. NPDC048825 TaxID=3365592 RepID=UPI00371964A1
MSVRSRQHLSLPEEFVLLSHLASCKVHGSARAVIGCAAAELGELALRRKLLVRSRKSKMLGFDVYRLHGVEIELLDTGPTGLVWADALLAELQQHCSASEHGRVRLHWWFRRHHQAFSLHRAALAERGVLRPEPGERTGLSRFPASQRHCPDRALRDALIAEVRAAGSEHRRLDEHMLFLCDLVEAVGLSKDLGAPMSLRRRLDRGRGVGAVESVPEELRDTSSALAALVPTRDNDARYGRPRV